MMSDLEDSRYPKVESLWYHDVMNINKLVLLKNDLATKRMND